MPRSHAGTGRRDGLKIRWEQSRVGSSPTVSTSSAVPEAATTGSTAQTYADAANAQESWARGFESLRHCTHVQGRALAHPVGQYRTPPRTCERTVVAGHHTSHTPLPQPQHRGARDDKAP